MLLGPLVRGQRIDRLVAMLSRDAVGNAKSTVLLSAYMRNRPYVSLSLSLCIGGYISRLYCVVCIYGYAGEMMHTWGRYFPA